MNEPVAWMLMRNECHTDITEWYGIMRGWEEFLGDKEKIVELYTHPVIELTDEEILNLWWDSDHTKDEDDLILTFAKTILKER